MTFPLSLSFLTTFDCTPSEAVEIAAETGYDLVGLRASSGLTGEPELPLLNDPATLRETRAALRDTKIDVADIELIRLGPEIIDTTWRIIDRAEQLTARHILVVGEDPEPERLRDNFIKLCEACAPAGMTADLEIMPWTPVFDIAASLSIVDEACPINGGILLDALHLDRSGDPPEAILQIPAARLHYIQFCDGPSSYDPSMPAMIDLARTARLNPGEASNVCAEILNFVPAGTTISLEVPNHARARTLSPKQRAAKALEAMRKIVAEHGAMK